MIIRHGFSTWNEKNLFTGWVDVELSDIGEQEAHRAGAAMKEDGFVPDVVFTSVLKRAIDTATIALEDMGMHDVETIRSWRLNERHYGGLTGLDKKATVEQYGPEQVNLWRRSFDVPPPEVEEDSPYNSKNDPLYSDVPCTLIPLSECLKDVCERVMPYFEETIAPKLLEGENVLVVAHGNSLRALIKKLEGISDEDIASFELPTGTPRKYTFNSDFTVQSAGYIEDEADVAARAQAVKNQTSTK
jgi:2,3-bisphosphoglycerate-dependent phosphoglycerate mutase